MPANQHRPPRGGILSWWRQWSKRESTIAAVILAVLLLTFTLSIISDSRTNTNPSSNTDTVSEWVPFTPLSKAQQNAAFCLDGSVPGYHMQKGFGSGSDSWLLHIEGGGWCNTISSCSSRKRTPAGSSKYMDRQVQFSGLLSCNPLQNPDFFNWNRVKIRYCDGASFSGHPESEFNNGTKLFFRGQLIWNTLVDELLSIGMSTARQALLTGCSAGGLATLIHCDDFREIMPKDANVKCLADAGFFLNEKDIAGNHTIESFYRDVVHLQGGEGEFMWAAAERVEGAEDGVSRSLNKECVARSEPSKCFFPQEFIKSIKTPVFLVNPAYDFWQIRNILVPDASDPNESWRRCRLNIYNCNPKLLEVLQGFRNALLKTLVEFQQNEEGGMFINSCFVHCQTWIAETWHSPTSPRINNKTIAESVGDWYFNRKTAKHIDCPFPCNPNCYNLEFGRG